ncbi:MAG: cytochrome ubiquinol oxidase subunit I, partial [Pseudomonadota bacterium]
FPTITIALCWFLLYFRIRHLRTGDPAWLDAYGFWVKVFALSFALGVVSGITMSFQFGTNWPGYMETVGNVAGPLLAYEVLTAFFLEATFLGIMLFGTNRVSPRIHVLATLLVAIGTTLSAFWILALNSWMHTPAGHTIENGQVIAENWQAIIFNPSMPYRLMHMLLASGLTASFLIAGISAYRLLRKDKFPSVKVALRTAVISAACLIPVQIFVGDLHGLNTLEHQPAKVAAMEGVWETERGAPLLLFAVPDENNRENHFEIGIPKLASFILTHDFNGEIIGLNDFNGEHPPVAPVFYGFRLMVGVGMLMLLISWAAAWQIRRHGLPGQGLQKALVAMTFSGWVATLAGWYVTEIGRQPWLVHGLPKTADAVSPVPPSDIAITLTIYLSLYAALIVAYITTVFHLANKAKHAGDPSIPGTLSGATTA